MDAPRGSRRRSTAWKRRAPRTVLVAAATLLGALALVPAPTASADPSPVVHTSSAVGTTGYSGIAVGIHHACGLRSDGEVWCWGANNRGQIGDGTQTLRAVPAAIAGTEGTTALALGYEHTCRLASGSIWCWGNNVYGQLGDGTTTDHVTPTKVPGITTATAITSRAWHTCALLADQTVRCWGHNDEGQIGDGSTTDRPSPTSPTGLNGVTSLASGLGHTCARSTDGTIRCWGNNAHAELGDGTTTDRPVPTAVTAGATTFASVAAGGIHTCGIVAAPVAGTLACWGNNSFGEVGDGTTSTNRSVPTAVTGLTGVTSVTLGTFHTCALAGGAASCWGRASVGQIGDGGTTNRPSPTAVTGLTAPVEIAATGDETCARTSGGRAWCWGQNQNSQLGDGTTTNRSIPTAVQDTPTAPGTPTAVPGHQAVTLTWTAPAFAGGLPITGYVITPAIAGIDQASIAGGTGTSTVVTGLTNGVAYTFTVAATNALGTGPASAASPAVAPRPPHSPFASWSSLVVRVTTDLTAVGPTSAELDAWVAALSLGSKDQGDLVASLRGGEDNLDNVDPTVRLYRAFLGRAPDAGGLRFWINRRRTGSWTLVRIADAFASSTEFKRTYGSLSNQQFVTRIYTDVLGRTADPAGVTYWTRQLDLRRRSRGSVMVGFSESNEYRRKQADNTDVAVVYISLMGRSPTVAETTDWVERRTGGESLADLALELLRSDPYATHITT